MTRIKITLVALTTLGTAGAANAAHPLSVAGNWNATANQTLGVLAISQPFSAATCKPITGTIFGNTIEGYYCPAVGRIVFARRTGGGTPFQLYEAHVSRDGVTDRIGGSFLIWNASGGGFSTEGVDFNFSATK
ncbi:MAG: hypothetical protein ACREDV_00995 [Methylocella sp.]